MKKNTKAFLIAGAILLVLLVVAIISNLQTTVNKNPDGFIGNTASNLYNGGTFCEHNGKVYFANSNDFDALYVMNADESKAHKISDTSVLAINVDGHRIYYSMSPTTKGKGLGYIKTNAGLYSVSLKGNNSVCFSTNPVAYAFLYGNKVYYQCYQQSTGSVVFSTKTNREDNHEILSQMATVVCADNNNVYFTNMDKDHYLYALDPAYDTAQIYIEKDMYLPIVENDWVYYLDPHDDYSLKRYSISQDEEQILCDERVDFYNKYGDFIYYQTNSSTPALKRVFIDGTNEVTIAEGIYNNIQTTSNYVYFRPFDNPTVTYHASHYGSVAVSQFNPK